MDFARELDEVGAYLAERGFRVAVIGGVALAAYGHPRMTLDLDLVTEAAAQDTLVAFMESRGFVTLHRSSGYSNHRHPDRMRGRVDFMYVRDHTAERTWQDLADVGYLLRIGGVDREEVRRYFQRAGLEEKWHELVRAL